MCPLRNAREIAVSESVVLDDTFVEFTVNGKTVTVEAFEALQELADVDRRHEFDCNECLDCQQFCGEVCGCGSKKLRASMPYRSDLAATMQAKLGMPLISGRTALAIYLRLIEVVESKKNVSLTTLDSPGGTESPPAS
jgi:hypothetical protein